MRFAALLLAAVFLPALACAAELVNINTADAALLDTLPGIGPAKAAAIIEYREANGPFSAIEDIQNVSGIGPTTYEGIEGLITVGGSPASPPADEPAPPPDNPLPEASSTPPSQAGGPAEYLPIPALRVVFGGDRIVSSGADTAFSAAVYDSKGNRRDEALITWAFGDGMKRTGASVFHTYYYPGEYAAVVRATTPDGGDASVKFVVTASEAGIKISSVSSRGISLANSGTRTLDLSFWRLSAGGQEFRMPEDTQILGGRTVLFPSQITKLPFADSAVLLYPSGETAAAYPEAAIAASPASASGRQPSAPQASFTTMQAVEPITSTKANSQSYENAVIAPRETEAPPVSRGAASPALAEGDSRAAGIFHSPWTLGFLGIVALAGSAFIFL